MGVLEVFEAAYKKFFEDFGEFFLLSLKLFLAFVLINLFAKYVLGGDHILADFLGSFFEGWFAFLLTRIYLIKSYGQNLFGVHDIAPLEEADTTGAFLRRFLGHWVIFLGFAFGVFVAFSWVWTTYIGSISWLGGYDFIVFYILLFFLVLALAVRIMPFFTALSVEDGSLTLKDVWQLTKGKTLKMLLIYSLALAPIIGIAVALIILVFSSASAAFLTNGFGLLLLGLGVLLLKFTSLGVLVATGSEIFRRLVDRPDFEEVFD